MNKKKELLKRLNLLTNEGKGNFSTLGTYVAHENMVPWNREILSLLTDVANLLPDDDVTQQSIADQEIIAYNKEWLEDHYQLGFVLLEGDPSAIEYVQNDHIEIKYYGADIVATCGCLLTIYDGKAKLYSDNDRNPIKDVKAEPGAETLDLSNSNTEYKPLDDNELKLNVTTDVDECTIEAVDIPLDEWIQNEPIESLKVGPASITLDPGESFSIGLSPDKELKLDVVTPATPIDEVSLPPMTDRENEQFKVLFGNQQRTCAVCGLSLYEHLKNVDDSFGVLITCPKVEDNVSMIKTVEGLVFDDECPNKDEFHYDAVHVIDNSLFYREWDIEGIDNGHMMTYHGRETAVVTITDDIVRIDDGGFVCILNDGTHYQNVIPIKDPSNCYTKKKKGFIRRIGDFLSMMSNPITIEGTFKREIPWMFGHEDKFKLISVSNSEIQYIGTEPIELKYFSGLIKLFPRDVLTVNPGGHITNYKSINRPDDEPSEQATGSN